MKPKVPLLCSKIGLVLVLLSVVLNTISSPIYAAGDAPPTISGIVKILQNIIKMLTPIAAVAFLAMMIFGAYKFITSGGDPKGAAGARSTFTYAIIGIILIIAAWLILLLIKQVTKVDVTNVSLPI